MYPFNPDDLPHVYGYDGNGKLITDTATHPDGTVYVKTYTWTNGLLTGESPWVIQ